jgi:hypothetical protein
MRRWIKLLLQPIRNVSFRLRHLIERQIDTYLAAQFQQHTKPLMQIALEQQAQLHQLNWCADSIIRDLARLQAQLETLELVTEPIAPKLADPMAIATDAANDRSDRAA